MRPARSRGWCATDCGDVPTSMYRAWRLRALLAARRLREARVAELDVLLVDVPVRPSSLDLALA